METTFDKLSPTNARLKVVLSETDYKPEVDKKLKEYAKTAKIKGFRPGQVPIGYIKKLYGKSVLVDEVINKVSKVVNEYIADNKLKIVGDPIPNEESYKIDWENDTEYTFEYEVGTASDFTVDIDKLPAIVNYEIEPSQEQINESIDSLTKRFGVDIEPEEAELGDIIFGTLKQESSEFEFKSGIPTDKVIEKSQHIFKGLEKGSSVKFDIQNIFADVKSLGFATGKSDEDAAALAGEFEFVVDKISRMTPSELNQELFDKALGQGKVSSEEEFRNEVKSVIKENYNRESGFLLDFDVEKALVDNIQIDLPDEFLKKWLLQVNEGKVTIEDIENEFEAFKKGLRLDLIKAEIVAKYELKVEYPDVLEEVKNEIRGYFSQSGSGSFDGMEEFIDKMARQQLTENKDNAFRNYFNKAFGRKVVTFLKEKLTIENKSIQVEEFNQIAKEKYNVA